MQPKFKRLFNYSEKYINDGWNGYEGEGNEEFRL